MTDTSSSPRQSGLLYASLLLCLFMNPRAEADPDDESPRSPQEIENQVLRDLIAGKQRKAEKLLERELARYPDIQQTAEMIWNREPDPERLLNARADRYRGIQRLVFLHAACMRSRFEKEEAFPVFGVVCAIDSTTPVAKCALKVIQLDSSQFARLKKKDRDKVFEQFEELVDANPNEVMIRWMLAVGCRTWDRNEEGVRHYRRILEQWNPGPVLVHQTYANLLDKLKRYEEALVERRKAVELESAGWSYDGLANTLHYLGRFEEACEAHANAVRTDSQRSNYWSNWASTLRAAGKLDEAIAKCQHAIDIHPDNELAWWTWAKCLESQGKKAEALEKYQKALRSRRVWPQ
jgi:tetratricopeptide (TPR) repeat protein